MGGGKILAIVLLTLTPALMGARCSPSRRARSLSASCSQPGPFGATCTADATPASATSALGTLPACLRACRPQPASLSVANGAACVVDPCDDASFTGPPARVMCPENWSCVPNSLDGRTGQCRRLDAEVLGSCHPGDTSSPCPTGTYCRQFTTSGVIFSRPSGTRFMDTTRLGMCVPPVREGGVCDTSPGTVSTTTGRQCEPGLECAFMPGTSTGDMRCQRRCDGGLGDCPCDTPGNTISCRGSGTSTAYCSFCFADRTECSTQLGVLGQCCNSSSTCQTVNVGGMAQQQCCTSNGNSCTSSGQCCNNSVCRSDGKCGACQPAGQSGTASTCCPGTSPVGGICSVPCIDPLTMMDARPLINTPCQLSASGPQCNRTHQCDPAGGYECRAPSGRTEGTSCNGVDDDCNGTADNGIEVPCTYFPAECGGSFGVPNGGTRRCGDAPGVCRRRGSARSYCFQDTSGNVFPASGPAGDLCSTGYSGVHCGPGGITCLARETCGPVAGYGCNFNAGSGVCGTNPPGGGDGCGETTTGGCLGQCRATPSSTPQCWMPGM
jgi:hypothetical protein